MFCRLKIMFKSNNRLINTGLIRIIGHPIKSEYNSILTNDAKDFLIYLHKLFNEKRLQLLDERIIIQQKIDSGFKPQLLNETKHIRDDIKWKVVEPANGLIDRRVEITGPVERKMIINALNSGANCFMADFEDSNSPSWTNCMDGQVNLKDAVNGSISLNIPNGKSYKLNDKIATLLVRPRGWHLDEKHVLIDSKPISASLFDFGLYFFHNAKQLIEKGFGPYFYLPKMENYFEAKLWNDVFCASQQYIGISRGSIRATCLIETILSVFQMQEILYELREHSSGLNCGRWDYIFSFIKKFGKFPEYVLPDRSRVTMTTTFMDAYVKLLIHTCHKRGAHAIGGMAAQIPIRTDPQLNEEAMKRVKEDKTREVMAGHDGTWVAHPGLVEMAKQIFDDNMNGLNQLNKNCDLSEENVNKLINDLLNISTIDCICSENGLRNNISVSLIYLDEWLNNNGCVPINYLMEDMATAEISRTQLWQWLTHKTKINRNNGEIKSLDKRWLIELINEESNKLKLKSEKLSKTKLNELIFSEKCPEFLTNLCYDNIISIKS